MFEALGVWHQVMAVSAWTGMSAGALIGLAALVYFNPPLLKFAIAGAVLVAAAYVAEIHGNVVGLKDGKAIVQAKWDQAKAGAQAARDRRDGEIRKDVTDTLTPQLAALRQRTDQLSEIVRENAKSHPPGGATTDPCRLGDRALRLRQ